MKRSRSKLGFTLLELLIVVIIIGILAAVALPGFGRMVRRSRTAEAQNVVGSMLTAEFLYYQERRSFASAAGDLLVDIPPSANFAYSVTGATATTATVLASGQGGAGGISVTGTVNDAGTRTIAVTGA